MNIEKKSSLLLVEDEILLAMSQKVLLEREGYKVTHSLNGENAIKLITEKKVPIDLILMDIDLGKGMDGTETAKLILRNHDIPILFVSSHTEKEIVQKTEKITSYGYVVKNSGITILDASIKMAFKLYEANQKVKAELAERKRTEERLKSAELASKCGNWELHLDSQKIISSDGANKLYGVQNNEFDYEYIKQIPLQEYRPILDTALKNLIEHDIPYDVEFKIKTADTNEIKDIHSIAKIDRDKKIIFGIIQDITDTKKIHRALQQSEKQLKKLLIEKETLLKEVHHRIKNNLYTIYALLTFHSETQENISTKSVLQDAASRVQSMMILYDKLYRSEDNSSISIKEYLPILIEEIMSIFPQKSFIKVNTKIDAVILNVKTLSSLSILVNELITNTMKYAFINRDEGNISVMTSLNENQLTVIFEDDGVGMPESISIENSSGFGLQLVGILVQQIEGSISIERKLGTRFIIQFKI